MSGVHAGLVLAGRYRLLDLVAEGAMGEVWRGRDDRLDRDVAVKVLRSDLADDDSFLERFRGEARHAAAVRHPHVASVHDYGEDPATVQGGASTAYLVMDLLLGKPLDQVLAEEGPFEPGRVAGILAQTADALSAAHAIGLVHRDVKPANLLLGAGDDVTVTDFGIARAADAVPVTRTGLVMGTAEYLSPEQARGERASAASDVYSLGVVGYELLTGSPPFTTGSPAVVAAAHVNDPVPPLPSTVPAALARAVLRCLGKDPAGRPSVTLLATRLRALAAGLAPADDDAWSDPAASDPAWSDPAASDPDPVTPADQSAGPPPTTPTTPTGFDRPPVRATTAVPVQPPAPGRRRRWTRSPLLALLLLALLLMVGYLLDARGSAVLSSDAPHLTTTAVFHVEPSVARTTAKDGR